MFEQSVCSYFCLNPIIELQSSGSKKVFDPVSVRISLSNYGHQVRTKCSPLFLFESNYRIMAIRFEQSVWPCFCLNLIIELRPSGSNKVFAPISLPIPLCIELRPSGSNKVFAPISVRIQLSNYDHQVWTKCSPQFLFECDYRITVIRFEQSVCPLFLFESHYRITVFRFE